MIHLDKRRNLLLVLCLMMFVEVYGLSVQNHRKQIFTTRTMLLQAKNVNDDDDDNNNIEEDWRDYRAKLVMQYRRHEQEKDKDENKNSSSDATSTPIIIPTTNKSNNSTSSNEWAYESGDVIECGSLIVSHPSQDFSCGGLRQQYFYKSVVLVVEHTPIFTKGIILNRPTERSLKDDHNNDWKVWFGGDVQGIHSDEEAYLCLHRLDDSSQLAKDLSTPILKDISSTPWEIAQVLVDAGEATKDDFWLCCGYSGWAPGQLQDELERGNWFMVATDVESVWKMIGQDLTNPQGTDLWVQVMKRIGKEYMTSCMPDQKFKDDMLKEYVAQKFLTSKSSELSSSSSSSKTSRLQEQARKQIFLNLSPGTLVRASSPILLDEQVFHQSLVLIVQNDENLTVGCVLNRPSFKSIEVDGTKLPVRFGGRFGYEGQGKPELWFHCNHQGLQDAKVGEPLDDKGEKSMFWKCTQEDAESAVTVGLAEAEDFLVVEGVSVWNKNPLVIGSQPQSPIDINAYFSEVDAGAIGTVWKLLLAQEPLNKKNAVENLEAANAAWMLSGNAAWLLSGSGGFENHSSDMQTREQQKVQSLAYSALDRWIRLFLMQPS